MRLSDIHAQARSQTAAKPYDPRASSVKGSLYKVVVTYRIVSALRTFSFSVFHRDISMATGPVDVSILNQTVGYILIGLTFELLYVL